MKAEPTRRIVISDDILSQEVNVETVLLNPESEQCFTLDAVAKRIWQLLGDDNSLEQVLESLLEEYDVGREQLERDLEDLLRNMAEHGLLRYRSRFSLPAE